MFLIRLAAVALWLQCAWAGEAIHLKSRTIEAGRAPFGSLPLSKGKYLLVQFDRRPGPEVRAELARRGFSILSFVPDSSLMLAVPDAPDLRGLGVRWAGPLEPGDKLSKLLEQENTGAFLITFHPGVDPQVARGITRHLGFLTHDTEGLLPGHLLVTGNHGALAPLAANEEIAYIQPAGPELFTHKRIFGCPGPVTETGPIADYTLADAGWPKDSQGRVALQYFFDTITRKLDSNVARSQVERAFSEWARYADVTFTPAAKTGGARAIAISFATGAHGDAYPFTSIATLAHAFYPAPPNPESIAGDVHLNDAQPWGVGNSIDLFSVALHELGHALGLGHSDNPGAVMYPYYKLAGGLTNDDIAAIQALYGAAGVPAGTPNPPTVPTTPAPPGTPPAPAPPGGDTSSPTVTVLTPSFTILSTSAVSITVSGTARDNVGVTAVKWTTSTGNSGTASGTSSWSAVVPLLVGTNSITIRAYDAAGNTGWRTLTAVRN